MIQGQVFSSMSKTVVPPAHNIDNNADYSSHVCVTMRVHTIPVVQFFARKWFKCPFLPLDEKYRKEEKCVMNKYAMTIINNKENWLH